MSALRGQRILLIDAARDCRDAMALLLALEGATVLACAGGRDAIALARRHELDVVLADAALADIPADMVIREFARPGARAPRVAATTCSEADVPVLHEAGASAVFVKPLAWERLVAFLNDAGAPAASSSRRRPASGQRPHVGAPASVPVPMPRPGALHPFTVPA
jgi:DNA-binding NtrC family response regulator